MKIKTIWYVINKIKDNPKYSNCWQLECQNWNGKKLHYKLETLRLIRGCFEKWNNSVGDKKTEDNQKYARNVEFNNY